jgi:hypothetical protein
VAQKVKDLRGSSQVDRVWTIDGRIRFTKTDNTNVIIKLGSPFISLEEALLKK